MKKRATYGRTENKARGTEKATYSRERYENKQAKRMRSDRVTARIEQSAPVSSTPARSNTAFTVPNAVVASFSIFRLFSYCSPLYTYTAQSERREANLSGAILDFLLQHLRREFATTVHRQSGILGLDRRGHCSRLEHHADDDTDDRAESNTCVFRSING